MNIKLAILPALLLLAQAASAAPVYQFQQVHKGLQADASPVVPSDTVPAAPAYAFTAHTFTNCLATGALGPSEAQCRTQYASAAWTANPQNFSVSAGIQRWTVPETGNYQFVISGAGGGFANAYSGGARYGQEGTQMTSVLTLQQGQVLQLLVGQVGSPSSRGNAGGGGGASFVVSGSTPLLVAAGGYGAPYGPAQARIADAGFALDGASDPNVIPAQSFLHGGAGGQPGGVPNMCNSMLEAPAIGGFGGGGAHSPCSAYQAGGAGYARGADGTGLSYSVVTPQVAPLPRYNYYLEPGAIIVTKLAP